MKHVRLTRVIYVELLISHAPIVEKIRIFEQEQISKELEEELEATLSIIKKTITSIVKLV
jgi:hypothetical protein